MKIARTGAAILLALPLIAFGANKFFQFFELPEGDGSSGDQLLTLMHDGGLMTWIALSHIVAGVFLILPPLRFLGALAQLPITLGIVAFHATMLPAGLGVAIGMLVLNVIALAEPARFQRMLSNPTS